MKTLWKNAGLLLMLLVLLNGCHKKDPCAAVPATSAAFQMKEYVTWAGGLDTLFEIVDTMFARNALILTAEQELEAYEWHIGSEVQPRTGKRVTVTFNDRNYGPISIRLVGRKTPDPACHPTDDGIDTVERVVYVVSQELLPLWGKFRGELDDLPGETFTVEVMPKISRQPPVGDLVHVVRNFPQGCAYQETTVTGRAFRLSGRNGSSECLNAVGWGLLSDDGDTLRIGVRAYRETTAQNPDGKEYYRQFVGLRTE